MNNRLSIIIPVFNCANFTKFCLLDLIKIPNEFKIEIIIVDNNSSDNTEQIIKEIQLIDNRVKYIKSDKNLLHSGGCNLGYYNSNFDFDNILFLNNDIRIDNYNYWWINKLNELCKGNNLIGINGGLVDNNFNFIKETNKIIDNDMFYLSGWFLCASKNTFNKLILKNELGPWRSSLYYFNDGDISYRAKQLNISFELINAPLTHFKMQTTKKYSNVSEMYLKSQKIIRGLYKDKK